MSYLLEPDSRGRTPVITISIDGREVAAGFYSRLTKVNMRDEAGQNADKITFELDDARNELLVPREKATITAAVGYRETGVYPRGPYEMQPLAMAGGGDGERLIIQGEAADLRRRFKGVKRRSWENKTFGEIARDIARDNDAQVVISDELAALKLPYTVQMDGSDIDFLTRLGDEHGAIVKPMGDRLVITERGSATSASGSELADIIISKSDCSGWHIEPNGRVEYGRVSVPWTDQKTGKRKIEEYETGLSGPELLLPEAQPDQDRAKRKAQAEGRRLSSDASNGHFIIPGRPDAQAGARVIARGFRPEINGAWLAHAVEDTLDEGGYVTKIEVKAIGGGKAGGRTLPGAAAP